MLTHLIRNFREPDFSNFKTGLLALFVLFCGLNAYGQQMIKGSITDETNGEPVPGVIIVAEGTSGTISDASGNFKLSVPSSTSELSVKSIGYLPKKLKIDGRTDFKIVLQPDIKQLNDVVVIGYQSVQKKDLTGAVSSISTKDLEDLPVASALEAMTGKLAGVNITTTEGSPDATINIRIRGGTSITQDNSPLFIVDGFPAPSIANIAPGDIQSIDVLKDAASTAIYGSQGANGVVIVTTKSGKNGKISVNLNAFTGIKKAYNFVKVLSPYEYVYYQKELDPGSSVSGTSFYGMYGLWEDRDIYRSMKGDNWQEKLYGNTGVQRNYNASVNGGSDFLRYNLSLTHDDEDYIMLNSGYKRDNVMLKTNSKISKTLNLDFAANLSNIQITGPAVSSGKKMKDCLLYAPVKSLTSYSVAMLETEDNGTLPEAASALKAPYEDIMNEYKEQYKFENSYNAGLSWKLFEHLQYRTQLQYAFIRNHTDDIWVKGTGESSSNGGQPVAQKSDDKGNRWYISNTLAYDAKLGQNHVFSAVVGEEASSKENTNTFLKSKFYPADMSAEQILAMWNYGTALPTYTTISEPERKYSYFSSLNYTLMGRYLFRATAREDGVNVFAPGHRWGFFPAFSGAWRISDEAFLKNQQILSNLKLRVSRGVSGNSKVSSFWRQDYSFESTSSKLYYPNEVAASALKASTTLYNQNLTWETTVESNVGLDFGFFNERVRGAVELYDIKTKDLIMLVPLPVSSGYVNQYQNVGQTSNKGLEISMSGDIATEGDFKLSADFNIAFNRNSVDKFVASDGTFSLYQSGWGLTTSSYDYVVQQGKPLGQMYGYVTEGMYSFDDFDWDNNGKKWVIKTTDSKGNKVPNLSKLITASGSYFGPGHLKLKDLNGDGDITEADRTIIGNAQPLHTGGLGLNASWKGFDAAIFFNWSYGNDIYNANKIDFTNLNGSKKYNNLLDVMSLDKRFTTIDPETGNNIYYGTNADPEKLQALNKNASIWHPIINTTVFHSWAVEDGSFLRLSKLTLGYTLPKRISKFLFIEKLRVYVSGYNLHVWTKYSGQDPEVSTRNSTPLTPGVDYSAYPKAHSYTFGANLTF